MFIKFNDVMCFTYLGKTHAAYSMKLLPRLYMVYTTYCYTYIRYTVVPYPRLFRTSSFCAQMQ